MMPLSPEQIFGGLHRQESAARAWVYERYLVHAQTTAQQLIPGSPDLQDIVNEAFYSLFRHGGRFSRLKNIRRFLMVAVRNGCINYLKHQHVVRTFRENLVANQILDEENGLEYMETLSYDRDLVYQAMKELPAVYRRTFYLFFAMDLNIKEIAKELEQNVNTIDSRITRAKQILKQKIRKNPQLYALTIFL